MRGAADGASATLDYAFERFGVGARLSMSLPPPLGGLRGDLRRLRDAAAAAAGMRSEKSRNLILI